MTTTEQILLIILSIFLAIFLLLSIVVLIWLIKIFRQLKRIIDKAERLTDRAEIIAHFFERTAPHVAIGRLISNITQTVFNKSSNNKRKAK